MVPERNRISRGNLQGRRGVGATTVNIPDTVGWAVPDEFGQLIAHLHDNVKEFQTGKAVISVHCHNDLAWPSPTHWPPCKPEPVRWNAP